jgi:hypothetical protein
MFCKKCGAELPEDSKFCKKCGTPVENNSKDVIKVSENEEKDPLKSESHTNSGNNKKHKKEKKKAERANWSLGKRIGYRLINLLLGIFLVLALLTGALAFLPFLGITDNPLVEKAIEAIGPDDEEDDEQEAYYVEPIDADEYFEQTSEVLADYDINESEDILTEEQIYNELVERGFEGYPITVEYDMDGVYYKAVDISQSSSDKHPVYHMDYSAPSGEIWDIIVINDAIMANPLSYNIQSTRAAQLVISETDVITSYDSAKNKFYENIPYESELIVIVVDKIDAETLERITIEELDEL